MRKILIFVLLFVTIVSQGQNYTKLFRNRIEADMLKARYWLILNGDSVHSINPTEGQILKFTGGKYVNSNPDALAADSMVFDKTTGILKIYKNGFPSLQYTLDGRYPTFANLADSENSAKTSSLSKAVYDPANIAQQLVGATATQTLTNKTLTKPAISDYTLAQHDHSSAAQGGLLASNVFTVNLPVASTVAGRCAGALEGTDYPAGWVLAAGTSSVDLVITHNLGRNIANVTVFSIDANGKRLLMSNAAYSGYVAPTTNSLKIEALATVTKPLMIQLIFGN